MARVEIMPVSDGGDSVAYAAVSGDKQSRGRTPGEALDALMTQLADEDGAVLAIVQTMRPDRFFGADQQRRLGELMTRWREARDAGVDLPAAVQSELDDLINEEVRASGRRAAALLDDPS
jgi:hypothetical protein